MESTDIPSLDGKRWHVAVVKPQVQCRDIARKALKARGYSVLMPMCRELVAGKAVERPMYGRYLFVGVGADQDGWSIRWVPGIQHMTLDARRRPVTVGIQVLGAIVDRMMQDGGIVDLCPKLVPVGSGFLPGQTVRVTDGAFDGMAGLFEADEGERCRVLLQLFDRETVAHVPARKLIAA